MCFDDTLSRGQFLHASLPKVQAQGTRTYPVEGLARNRRHVAGDVDHKLTALEHHWDETSGRHDEE